MIVSGKIPTQSNFDFSNLDQLRLSQINPAATLQVAQAVPAADTQRADKIANVNGYSSKNTNVRTINGNTV
jgi:hypothetical protein